MKKHALNILIARYQYFIVVAAAVLLLVPFSTYAALVQDKSVSGGVGKVELEQQFNNTHPITGPARVTVSQCEALCSAGSYPICEYTHWYSVTPIPGVGDSFFYITTCNGYTSGTVVDSPIWYCGSACVGYYVTQQSWASGASAPNFSVTVGTTNFSDTRADGENGLVSGTQTVLTISNAAGAGAGTVTVSGGGTHFDIMSPTTLNIAAGTSATVQVRFDPQATGAQTGTLSFTTNGNAISNLNLTGSGTAMPSIGTLTAPDCTIPSGASTCSTTLTWSVNNPISVNVLKNAVSLSTSPSGSQGIATVYYNADPLNTVTVTDTGLSSAITPRGDCVGGTSWNGSSCQPPPITNLTSQSAPTLASGALTRGTNVTFRGVTQNSGTALINTAFNSNFTYCWGALCTPSTVISTHAAGLPFAAGNTQTNTSGSFTLSNHGVLRVQHCVDSAPSTITESNETPGENCKIQDFTINNVLPTTSITAPAAGTYSQGTNLTFTGTGSDTDGSIGGYEWRDSSSCASGGTILNNTGSFNISSLSLGTHTIYLRAHDDTGAWSTDCPSRAITIVQTNLTSQSAPVLASGALTQGTNVTFRGVTQNSGTALINTAFNSNFTYCWGVGCTPSAVITTHAATVPMAAGNIQNNTSGSFTLSNTGRLRVQHCIDSAPSTITESDETPADNCKIADFDVIGPPVITTFTASPAVVTLGGNTTLTWAVTGATSCTASGGTGWSGPKAAAGGTQVLSPTADITYTLTCSNAAGSSTPRNALVPVVAPDLVNNPNAAPYITQVSGGLTKGSTAVFRSQVQNIGTASAGPFNVEFSHRWGSGGWTVLPQIAKGSLAPTLSHPSDVTPGIPLSQTGNLEIRYCVDSGTGAVAEGAAGEANNCRSTIFPVAAPNLVVAGPPYVTLASGSLVNGQSVTFNSAVRNTGAADTLSGFSNQFSYQWGGTSGPWTPLGGPIVKPYVPLGTTASVDTSSTLILDRAGTLYVRMCADSSLVIDEDSPARESDNCSNTSFTVTNPPLPTVTLTAAPPTPTLTQPTTITWTVSGVGVSACTASNGWSGSKSTTGGTEALTPAATTTYTIACRNPGGTTTQSVIVRPVAPNLSNADGVSPFITVTGSLVQGQNVTFSAAARNTAAAATLSGFSNNFTYRWGTTGGWTEISRHAHGALAANTTDTVDTSSPFSLTNNGTLQIQYCVDSLGQINEGVTGEANNCTVDTRTVNPPAAPTVTLTAAPTSLTLGASSNLTWTVAGALLSGCTASGGWAGAKSTSGGGPESVTPGATTAYHIQCTNPGGTRSATATVTVNAPNLVNNSAGPGFVTSVGTLRHGEIVTFRSITRNSGPVATPVGFSTNFSYQWDVNTGTWTDFGTPTVKPALGSLGVASQDTAPLTLNRSGTLYIQYCTDSTNAVAEGAAGELDNCRNTAFTIVPPLPPIVTLTAAPTTITLGASSNLTWTVSGIGVTACNALAGPWTGPKSTTGGSEPVSPTGNSSYTIRCTNPGGNTDATANVTVNAPNLDVSPDDITYSAAFLQDGVPTTFSARMRNNGTAPTLTGFSNNFTYRWGSSGGWTEISSHTKPSLNNGSSAAVDTSNSFTPDRSGTLEIQYCADSESDVPEGAGEGGDNCYVESFAVAARLDAQLFVCDDGTMSCNQSHTIDFGDLVDVRWAHTGGVGAVNCVTTDGGAYGFVGGASPGRDNDISLPIPPGSYGFAVRCTDGNGGTDDATAAVTMNPPAAPTLSVRYPQINPGSNAELSWNLNGNIYTCTLTKGSSDTLVLNDAALRSSTNANIPVDASTTFKLECLYAADDATASVTITPRGFGT